MKIITKKDQRKNAQNSDNLYYLSTGTEIHFDFAFVIFLQGTIVNSSLFTMYLS